MGQMALALTVESEGAQEGRSQASSVADPAGSSVMYNALSKDTSRV